MTPGFETPETRRTKVNPGVDFSFVHVFLKIVEISQVSHPYQACLYLYECICHGDSIYSHHFQESLHF